MNIEEGYGPEGIKQLKKDYADLKKNPPKIEKKGKLFAVMDFSNISKKYIPVGEYLNVKSARSDLKVFMKNHKETLAKILKLSKDTIKEEYYGVFQKTGTVSSKNDPPIQSFETKKEAEEFAKRRKKQLSHRGKKYYGMGYVIKPIKGDFIPESVLEEKFKEGDKVKIINPRHNDLLDGAVGVVKQHLGNEVSLDFPKPIKGARGKMIKFATRPAKQLELVKESLDEGFAPTWKVEFELHADGVYVIAKNEKEAMKVAERHIKKKYGGKWGKPISAEKQTNSDKPASRPRRSTKPRGGRSAFAGHKFGSSIGGDASNYREGVDVVKIYEGKKDFKIYHKTYSGALDEVIKLVQKNGYDIDLDGEWFTSVTSGPRKPFEGKTNSFNIRLELKGRGAPRFVVFQIYGMKKQYELNAYIT